MPTAPKPPARPTPARAPITPPKTVIPTKPGAPAAKPTIEKVAPAKPQMPRAVAARAALMKSLPPGCKAVVHSVTFNVTDAKGAQSLKTVTVIGKDKTLTFKMS